MPTMVKGLQLMLLAYVAVTSCTAILPWWQRKEVFPRDRKVFQGETLKVWCSNPSGIRQGIQFINAAKDVLTIPASEVNTAGGNVSAWVNITDTFFTAQTTVRCENVTDETFIYVEKPLQNVKDVTVVYNLDTDRLDITWLPGQTYLRPKEVKTVVHWGGQAKPGAILTSECDERSETACTIIMGGQSIVLVRFNVTLTGNLKRPPYLRSPASLWTAVDKSIKIMDHLKLEPPSKFTVVSVNSSCVDVSWDEYLFFETYVTSVYRIWAKRDGDEDFTLLVDGKKHDYSGDVVTVRVCDLLAASHYTFRLSVKRQVKGHWSEAAETGATTEEDSDTKLTAEKPTALPIENEFASQLAHMNRKFETLSQDIRDLTGSLEGLKKCAFDNRKEQICFWAQNFCPK